MPLMTEAVLCEILDEVAGHVRALHDSIQHHGPGPYFRHTTYRTYLIYMIRALYVTKRLVQGWLRVQPNGRARRRVQTKARKIRLLWDKVWIELWEGDPPC